jgi:hypothetical protein
MNNRPCYELPHEPGVAVRCPRCAQEVQLQWVALKPVVPGELPEMQRMSLICLLCGTYVNDPVVERIPPVL